jgi:putative CocE/NonD family hydrolase
MASSFAATSSGPTLKASSRFFSSVPLTAAPLGATTWILPSEPHREGYIVFLQDVRGRYTSDGEWYPFLHESEDGYDTIEWIAARPYSDGRVGILPSSREHMLNHVFRQLHRTCAVQVHHVQFGI